METNNGTQRDRANHSELPDVAAPTVGGSRSDRPLLGHMDNTARRERELDQKLATLRAAREVCIAERKQARYGHKPGETGHWGALIDVLADSERHLLGWLPCPEHGGPECLLCDRDACHDCSGEGWIDDGDGRHRQPCQACGSTGWLSAQMARRLVTA